MTDPILLTPGPLTTSADTKSAMLSDWGSWDGAFNALTASVCRDLVAIANAERKAEDAGAPLDVDELYVNNCFVNEGARWKRLRPAPMGRAFRYQKRTSHIVVEVAEHHKAAATRAASALLRAKQENPEHSSARFDFQLDTAILKPDLDAIAPGDGPGALTFSASASGSGCLFRCVHRRIWT